MNLSNSNPQKKEPRFSSIGISRLRIVTDGDGISTLVAGYGCPLRCKYCLNPQCFTRPQPWRIFQPDDLYDAVKIDDLYFQATGGGIVFGGGEPLLQPDFIHAFRQMTPTAWNFSLESSLNVSRDALEKVIGDIDYFIIDIKDMNPDIYRAYTGRDNQQVIRNLEYLICNVPAEKIRIRIPLIKGFNTDADREKSASILKKMGFEVFDFFTYRVDKS